ncbi:replication factor C large subunit [Aeropyrum pernix]|uniref:Replication factor C large subunit n=1 Tax=Aeropyrum pernix TaxID=56636 RepID=A0A401H9M1_AERPX|nr:replication factor C large subunit [Aeropyrum pernix]GBF09141.1 replication factor C large subunit [Aeropyrum pernix]
MPIVARSSRVPWVIKYRPKRVEDVVNQEQAKKILVPWFKAWLEGRKPDKRAALLYGPPGVGKTSLVEAIASEFNLEMIELNASDYRRRSDIERIVGAASRKRSMFKRGVVILLDEVDGINPREDAGGIEALLSVIKTTENPIVMTANDPWKDFLRPLREVSLMVEFRPLTLTHIVAVLQRICEAERIECEREALRYIAERSEGDLRSAINDLQAVAEGYGRVTLTLAREIVRGREKSIDIWRTLNQVFYKPRQAWMARKAVSQSEKDYEELIAWINDNIPRKYGEPSDLFRAFDALARATVFLGRAKFGGNWELLSYVFDLMGPGVAYARMEGEALKTRYSYPEKIRMMAQLRGVRETREKLAEVLAKRLLMSRRAVKTEVLPILHYIFRSSRDPTKPAMIALEYGLTENMVELLAGQRKSEILKAMATVKKARLGEKPVEPQEAKARSRGEKAGRDEGRKAGKRERKGVGLDFFLGEQ